MTTKHTPTTPLPHQVEQRGDGIFIYAFLADNPKPIRVAEFIRKFDADYYEHAANEYPRLFDDRAKLVEALRWIAEADAIGHPLDRQMTEAEFGNELMKHARALLRSLGED